MRGESFLGSSSRMAAWAKYCHVLRGSWGMVLRSPFCTNARYPLLNRTRGRGKYIIGMRANEPNRTHHYHQNHCEHHGILGNGLTLFVAPEIFKQTAHWGALLESP